MRAMITGNIVDMRSKVVIAIPAHLESKRLPRKVLAEIGGVPMLRRVLDSCNDVKCTMRVVVCTDSNEIKDSVEKWGSECIMTPIGCSSGSERIASVISLLCPAQVKECLVINVQADQPFLKAKVIDDLISNAHDSAGELKEVITPVYRIQGQEIMSPDVVKVLRGSDGRAITFSRSPIPHIRDLAVERWHEKGMHWGHVGIYGYRADVLGRWKDYQKCALEDVEKLEQLRLVNGGVRIGTFEVEQQCISVDTAQELERARQMYDEII